MDATAHLSAAYASDLADQEPIVGTGLQRDGVAGGGWCAARALGAVVLAGVIATGSAAETPGVQALRAAAEQGDITSRYQLGIHYALGAGGVVLDEVEAMRWYCLAADAGYAPAQVAMGLQYAQGRVVPQDLERAARWYRRAARQGDAVGQFMIGQARLIGAGVDCDPEMGATLIMESATQGYAPAQVRIGRCFEDGQGVPKNVVAAAIWYQRAALQGNAEGSAAAAAIERSIPEGERASVRRLVATYPAVIL